MEFLEKDLEEIIFKTSNEKLIEKGLSTFHGNEITMYKLTKENFTKNER